MSISTNNPILYPNVTRAPGQVGIGNADKAPGKVDGKPGEFDQVLGKELGAPAGLPSAGEGAAIPGLAVGADLGQIKSPLKFSSHATQRLQDRKITLDAATMAKVSDAVDKAQAKGVDDTLVLTDKAALIVSVKNRTVITAMDRQQLAGNVFTNIDGAVIV